MRMRRAPQPRSRRQKKKDRGGGGNKCKSKRERESENGERRTLEPEDIYTKPRRYHQEKKTPAKMEGAEKKVTEKKDTMEKQ